MHRRAAFLVPILLLLLVPGCQLWKIEVSGKIISYDFVRFDRMNLRYLVRTSADITQTGVASIREDGQFKIRINRENQVPYYLIINGIDIVPDVSVMGNSIEIADNRQKQIDMGNVYVYDLLKISVTSSDSAKMKDLQVYWEGDIPDIDYYKLEIIGKAPSLGALAPAMSISGIRSESFSMKSIEHELEREGKYKVGELEVVNNNASLEGAYFLTVYAIRLIGGTAMAVGKSTSLVIRIDSNRNT